MSQTYYRLTLERTGEEIADRLEVADRAWQRAVGLMGRRNLTPGAGLWLHPCNGVHTFFMRFPLDILMLDSELIVLAVMPNTRPCRAFRPIRGGHSVIELSAGAAVNVKVGDQLRAVPQSSRQSPR